MKRLRSYGDEFEEGSRRRVELESRGYGGRDIGKDSQNVIVRQTDDNRLLASMVDGFNLLQRDILFSAFKIDLFKDKDMDVFSFTSHVFDMSEDEPKPKSRIIIETIIAMAHDFVGTNNLNLFSPLGNFGSRQWGGKDSSKAKPTHISICLANITRFLFPKEDDVFLLPLRFLPIIPTVLVNGFRLTLSGFRTLIPNYNPVSVIANIRRLLNDLPLVPMHPWYNHFKGDIRIQPSKEGHSLGYTTIGSIAEVIDGRGKDDEYVTLVITELPIHVWTQVYRRFLCSLMPDFIQDFKDYCGLDTVHIEVTLSKKNYDIAKQKGEMKTFKLTTFLSTKHMYLLNKDNKVHIYDSPEEILKEFYELRLKYYEKCKDKYLKIYKAEYRKLDNIVKFIDCVLKRDIVMHGSNEELVNELRRLGFSSIPESIEKDNDSGCSEENDYDYILSLPILSFSHTKMKKLSNNMAEVSDKIKKWEEETAKSLWTRDLDALEQALKEKDKKEEEWEKLVKSMGGAKPIGSILQIDDYIDSYPSNSEMEVDAKLSADSEISDTENEISESENEISDWENVNWENGISDTDLDVLNRKLWC